jgi:hypothetical protein
MRIIKITAVKKKRGLALFISATMALTLWTALPVRASADESLHEGSVTPAQYAVPEEVKVLEPDAVIEEYSTDGAKDTNSTEATKIETSKPSTGTENENEVSLTVSSDVSTTADPETNGVYTNTDGFKYTVSEGEATIIGYTGMGGAVTIPSSVVGSEAEANIPVTAIGETAFQNNATLISVNIPVDVNSIHFRAFNGSKSLGAITVDESNPYYSAEDGVLFNKEKTTLVRYPEGKAGTVYSISNTVTSLNHYAFAGCTAITSVSIPDSVTSIGQRIFRDCTSLTSAVIPGSVTSTIGFEAFCNCTSLVSVTIPGSITKIDQHAFTNTGLVSVTIPEGIEVIDSVAFYNCKALTSVTIAESVRSIGTQAFYYCNKLEDVTILNRSSEMSLPAKAFPDSFQLSKPLKIWCYAGSAAQTYAGGSTVVMIEEVTLDETPLRLSLNEIQTLSPAVSSPASVNKGTLEAISSVVWSSSLPSVATVDPGTGKVTATGNGSAIITAAATTRTGVKTASRLVIVTTPVETTYPLSVNNGKGGSSFAAGAQVTIIANEAPTIGQEFAGWTDGSGNTNGFANSSNPTTVFTMPGNAATVTANYKYLYDAPATSIDYANERITGLESGESYSIGGGETFVANPDGTCAIDPVWFGTALYIVKNINGNIPASDVQNLPVPAIPGAPTAAGVNETVTGSNDGRITGVNAGLEYSSDGGNSWTSCTGAVITGLAPGSYQVRIKATTSNFAGIPLNVIITAGAAQTRTLTVQAPSFDAAVEGYDRPDTRSIRIVNTGNSPVTITGIVADGAAFDIGGSGATVGVGEAIATWTVQPREGLSAGTYTATVTVAYDGTAQATATTSVSFVVNAQTIIPPPVVAPPAVINPPQGATGGGATPVVPTAAVDDDGEEIIPGEAVAEITAPVSTSSIGEQETPQAASDENRANDSSSSSVILIVLIAALGAAVITAIAIVARRRVSGRREI